MRVTFFSIAGSSSSGLVISQGKTNSFILFSAIIEYNLKELNLDAGFSPVVYYRFAALLDRAADRV